MDSKKNSGVIAIAIIAVFLAVALAFCVGFMVGQSSQKRGVSVVQKEVVQEAPVFDEVEVAKEVEPIEEPIKESVKESVNEAVVANEQAPQPEIDEPEDDFEVEMGIAPSDPSHGEPAEILQIREWFQDTENNAKQSFQSGGVTCYRKNGDLVKIKVDAGYVLGVYDDFLVNNRREYFYRNNQLYFAHIVTANPAGDRFYYVDGNLIRYSDPNDKNHYYNEQLAPYMGLGYSCKTEGESLFWDNIAK